jgi:hypothetical protein
MKEPIGYIKLNSITKDFDIITASMLDSQPYSIKQLWIDAIPLYLSTSSIEMEKTALLDKKDGSINNGGKTSYYDVPPETKTLNDLIEHKNMFPFQHEIFKACYALKERALKGGNSSIERELNKIIYYANRGLELNKKGNL